MHHLISKIHQLAATEPVDHGPRRTFRTYAYELIPLRGDPTFTMYVGQTMYAETTRHRHHREGRNAYKGIINGRYAVGELRTDLFQGLPKFRCKVCAQKAEGYLADYVDAIGEHSYSDQGTGHARRKARKQARKARKAAHNA
ncbi:MAG TPA: hypothetical protein VGP37_02980 [Candidatus Nanopelagicales bacterium]|nr:hypothetical protein [Candidatus Nanopelagicales bacterium]